VEALTAAPDLTRTLAALPPAADGCEAFPRPAKRGILERITSAKEPDTGARRVEETARLAVRNVRANPWRR
jgi:uncharacterized protein YdeI (YjbR/CyaY-like superfamily)